MRLTLVMELVLAVGVGFGLARFRLDDMERIASSPTEAWIAWSEIAAFSVLAGTAFVGGLGTLAERLRGRSPGAWGPGRWAWSIIGVYLTLGGLAAVVGSAEANRQNGRRLLRFEDIASEFSGQLYESFTPTIPWVLLAGALVWTVAPAARPRESDAREWAGRVLAALLVLAAVLFRSADLFGLRQNGMGVGFQ